MDKVKKTETGYVIFDGMDLFVAIDDEPFGDFSSLEYNVDQDGKGTVKITRVPMYKDLPLRYGVLHCFYSDEFGGHAHLSLYLDELVSEDFKSSVEVPYPEVVQVYKCRVQQPYRKISEEEDAELRYPALSERQKKTTKKPSNRIKRTFKKHLESIIFDWMTFNMKNHSAFGEIIENVSNVIYHDISDEPQKIISAALKPYSRITEDDAQKIYSIACRNTEEELAE